MGHARPELASSGRGVWQGAIRLWSFLHLSLFCKKTLRYGKNAEYKICREFNYTLSIFPKIYDTIICLATIVIGRSSLEFFFFCLFKCIQRLIWNMFIKARKGVGARLQAELELGWQANL